MNTEETKDRKDKVGCTDFTSSFRGFQEMFKGMGKCCMGQEGSLNCSAMMEKCCGARTDNNKSESKSKKV
ncbi:MAG: hypothetical protein JRJ15_05120 [Deltaproteobacteria bacterium]|nr:hypothetical protein [Deltaproteobacteria bacterium]